MTVDQDLTFFVAVCVLLQDLLCFKVKAESGYDHNHSQQGSCCHYHAECNHISDPTIGALICCRYVVDLICFSGSLRSN